MRLKNETREIEFNGKQIKVSISITADQDDIDPRGQFDNPKDVESILSGKFELIQVCVRASFHGLDGFDSLGACHVHSGWESLGTGRDDIYSTVKENQMIETAIEDLKIKMRDFLEALDGEK